MALVDPGAAAAAPFPSKDIGDFWAIIIAPASQSGSLNFRVAGLAMVERLRRQALALGAAAVVIQPQGSAIPLSGVPFALLIDAGLVADERLLAAFVAAARRRGPGMPPLVAVSPQGDTGGLAWMPKGTLSASALSWSAIAAAADRCDLSQVDDYASERRRRVPLLWERPKNAAAARRVGRQVLAAAQKGCLDWPARFIHPPIENLAVRILWPTPVTPNAISLLTFALGLYAAWCFAGGEMWTGLLLALLVGPLDGIDGKLARTRVEFSRWGDLEHVGDKIVEYAWFAALAAAIGGGWAWALAGLIVVTALAEALQGEFFRRLTGAQLDDAGPFERRWRIVSGRRNTFFWTLVPFALAGRWDAGFVMIAVYAVVTFFVAQWRFFVRLADFGRQHSEAMAANLDASAYDFAPGKAAAPEPKHRPASCKHQAPNAV